MTAVIGALGVAAALTVGAARAQTTADQAPSKVTTDTVVTALEAEAAVLHAFPDVLAARAAIEAAEGELRAARLLPDPLLELGSVRTTARTGTAATTEPAGALEWEVPLPWSYRPGKELAARNVEAAGAALARATLAVRARVRALVVELAGAQERIEILAAQRALTADLGSLIALRVSLGESRELERLRTEVELARIDRALALARAEAKALVATLRHLSGDRLPDRFRLEGKLSLSVATPTSEELLVRALSENPLLAERRAERDAAAAALRLARGQRSPTLVSRIEQSHDLDTRSQGFSVGLRVPLWNANRGGIAAATARLRQAEASLESARREVAGAIASDASRLRGAREAAQLLEKSALRAARSAQEIADFSYRQGETSLLEALDVRRSFQAVVLEELEARRDLHLIRTELEGLGAWPLEPLPMTANGGPAPDGSPAPATQPTTHNEEIPQ